MAATTTTAVTMTRAMSAGISGMPPSSGVDAGVPMGPASGVGSGVTRAGGADGACVADAPGVDTGSVDVGVAVVVGELTFKLA